MTDLMQIVQLFEKGIIRKAVFSKTPTKTAQYKKIVINRKENGYQAEKYTDKQVFHSNLTNCEAGKFCTQNLENDFLRLNAWSDEHEYMVMVSKKGKVAVKKNKIKGEVKVTASHNKEKNYIIKEGTVVPPLVDMGIFTKDGKVVNSMYDKFRQINRFVEIIDDTIKDNPPEHLNIIDFGCGKSYLTFILYYYFTEIKHIDVNITGLDLKADVIKHCNESAQKYGYTNLCFELGDINGYKCSEKIDMVITLHACDTATDYALFNAISWDAEMIFSVPCCQHEINSHIASDKLAILTRYGILKERTSAIITDAIRGNLLTAMGYKTQIMEFIDLAHTPKNVLIRAIKKNMKSDTKQKALEEVKAITEEFGLTQTLYNLLKNSGKLQ